MRSINNKIRLERTKPKSYNVQQVLKLSCESRIHMKQAVLVYCLTEHLQNNYSCSYSRGNEKMFFLLQWSAGETGTKLLLSFFSFLIIFLVFVFYSVLPPSFFLPFLTSGRESNAFLWRSHYSFASIIQPQAHPLMSSASLLLTKKVTAVVITQVELTRSAVWGKLSKIRKKIYKRPQLFRKKTIWGGCLKVSQKASQIQWC